MLFHIQVGYGQPNTVHICPGATVELVTDSSFSAYRWIQGEGIENPTIFKTNALPTNSGLYIVEAIVTDSINLIQNGNFDKGNNDFTSDYTFSPGANPTQGVYGVFRNANDLSPMYFEHCRDHTNGIGYMMVVDGSPIANQSVWCQTIPVKPNTTYAFSTWLTAILQPNPAALQFSINGEQIGDIFFASDNNCEWRQFYTLWNSGEAAEAAICIINQNTNPTGNDFALDDFEFLEIIDVQYDSISVVIHNQEPTYIDTVFCEGTTIDYQGQSIPVTEFFNLTYNSSFGCDSLVIYQAQIVDTIVEIHRVDTLCPGDIIQFFDHRITKDTFLCESIISNGCDTTICLDVYYLTETAIQPDIAIPKCYGGDEGSILLQINAGLPPYQIIWNDGSIDTSRNLLSSGIYEVTVTDSKGCMASKIIPLTEPNRLSTNIQTESVICNGTINGILTLNTTGGTPPYRYSVQDLVDMDTASRYSNLLSGNYALKILDSNNCQLDTIVTIPEPKDVTISGPNDIEVNLGESIEIALNDNSNEILDYVWLSTTGVQCATCRETVLRPSQSGDYRIQATNKDGCIYEYFFRVAVNRDQIAYIPNVFSPNGDGINDQFEIFPSEAIQSVLAFTIFDRWGNQLLNQTNCIIDCGWDGLDAHQSPLPNGTYIYSIQVQIFDGSIIQLYGDVTIIR